MRRVRKIVLVRPAVEAGESLGFLPGDLQAKINPYLRPLMDALHEMIDHDQIKQYMEMDVIEVLPLAYMRGRTLNESFIILDEAQNTTIAQMKMFLTRMGMDSKIVVSGDVTQTDLPPHARSGLNDALVRLKHIEGVGHRATDQGRHCSSPAGPGHRAGVRRGTQEEKELSVGCQRLASIGLERQHGEIRLDWFPEPLGGVPTSMSVGTSVRSRSARVATVAASRKRTGRTLATHSDTGTCGYGLACASRPRWSCGRSAAAGPGLFPTAVATSRHGMSSHGTPSASAGSGAEESFEAGKTIVSAASR